MCKVLITGGSGYLGGNLAVFLRRMSNYNIYTTYLKNIESSLFDFQLDITDQFSVKEFFKKIEPNIVIHTSAVTNSNFCIKNKQISWKINVEGTKNIVDAASAIGARLIYISTDQVYSGDQAYSDEAITPKPICYYGQTKLAAENIVANNSNNFCIVRTSLIYGLSHTNKKNFFDNFIDNLLSNRQTKLFFDEYRTPIFLDNYCEILSELTEKKTVQGVYNVCGYNRISRYELGEYIACILKKPKALLIPVSIDAHGFIDKRPKDCSMSNKNIANNLETSFIGINQSIKVLKRQILERCNY